MSVFLENKNMIIHNKPQSNDIIDERNADQSKKKILNFSGAGLFQAGLSHFYSQVSNQLKITPGAEFAEAFRTAVKIKEVKYFVLGDRNVDVIFFFPLRFFSKENSSNFFLDYYFKNLVQHKFLGKNKFIIFGYY